MSGAAVITFKQLGDTLLLEPTLHHLTRRFGMPATLYAKPGFGPLIELMEDVCVPIPKAPRYEELWVFERGTRALRAAFVTRAREKRLVLLRAKYRMWYHRFVFDVVSAGRPRHYEYRARLLHREAGGRDEDFRPPQLLKPPESWRPNEQVPDRYLLVCPTAAWESKRWTAEAWGRSLSEFAGHRETKLVMVGGGSDWERAHAADIVAASTPPILNLVGRTSLRELLFLVARASSAVCIDGAVAHLAAAFGVPSVTLFGPTRPEEWHWPGEQSVALRATDHTEEARPPLSQLPIEPVVDAVLRLSIST